MNNRFSASQAKLLLIVAGLVPVSCKTTEVQQPLNLHIALMPVDVISQASQLNDEEASALRLELDSVMIADALVLAMAASILALTSLGCSRDVESRLAEIRALQEGGDLAFDGPTLPFAPASPATIGHLGDLEGKDAGTVLEKQPNV